MVLFYGWSTLRPTILVTKYMRSLIKCVYELCLRVYEVGLVLASSLRRFLGGVIISRLLPVLGGEVVRSSVNAQDWGFVARIMGEIGDLVSKKIHCEYDN